jgi:uncharacterized DUF497 family protein
MLFEWDEAKREGNILKHGVDFLRVQALFDGRPVITASSPRSDEVRYATTGIIEGRFYTAVWTWRSEAIRLISARRARYEEEQGYKSLLSQGDRGDAPERSGPD